MRRHDMRRRWAALAAAAILLAWSGASGVPSRFLLALRILDELRRPGGESWLQRSTPAPLEHRLALEAHGRRFAADLYRPARGRAGMPLLFTVGLVQQGRDDPRVAPFARLLARAGFTVVVPDLPSFRTVRAHPENLRELAAAHAAVTARHDLAPRGEAGLFGVSYGGGVALLVALDPAHAAKAPLVVSVGGYADLDSALRFLATGRTTFRGRPLTVAPDPYGQFVLVRTWQEFLDEAGDRRLLDAMVQRRLARPGAPLTDLAARLTPEGRIIHDLFETASPAQVPSLLARMPEGLRRRMAELSPARRDFAPLRARLFLVHARGDGTLPVGESERLAALARPHTRVRLVVLDALQHVDPHPWRRDPWGFLTRDLPEAWRLAWWWCDVLALR